MRRNRLVRTRRAALPPTRASRHPSPRENVDLPPLPHDAIEVPCHDAPIDDASIDPLRAVLVITARGGLTIPAAMRRALALDPGGRLLAETTPEGVLLRPATHVAFDPLDARQAQAMFAIDLAAVEAFLRKRRRRSVR
jgi:bifunctional DNA-binding transcriptional regulator/antitoxin component of YhaV-PrlF toxin-antitoxin module